MMSPKGEARDNNKEPQREERLDEGLDHEDGTKVEIHATVTSDDGALQCTNDVSVVVSEDVAKTTPGVVKAYFDVIPEEEKGSLQVEIDCARQLRHMGDWLNDRIEEVFRPLRRIAVDSRYEQFVRIAKRVFANGINWGRVAILFALALKYTHLCGRECVESMMGFLTNFITRKLIHWITESGGWTSLREGDGILANLPSPTYERVAIAALGVCCVAMVTYILVQRK